MVITGITDKGIQAYISNEGLARFCTSKYKKPQSGNYENLMMHLTNYSLNKTSNKYVEEVHG